MNAAPAIFDFAFHNGMQHFMVDDKLDTKQRHAAAVKNRVDAYKVAVFKIGAQGAPGRETARTPAAPGNGRGYRPVEIAPVESVKNRGEIILPAAGMYSNTAWSRRFLVMAVAVDKRPGMPHGAATVFYKSGYFIKNALISAEQ